MPEYEDEERDDEELDEDRDTEDNEEYDEQDYQVGLIGYRFLELSPCVKYSIRVPTETGKPIKREWPWKSIPLYVS